MPFGFGSITSFANKAVSAATNAASEAAKVAEKAVDTAAKAAETATAQVAAVAGEPPPAGQAPAARPAAPRAAAPRPQVPVQQAPRPQAPQMQQGPQMQTPAPQQQVQPRPPVSQQQQQQQQQQPQQPPMQRHTTPPQQAQTQQQQQPPPPQQQQQPPQHQMQQQQPPQQQMQQQQPPQQQMQQPQQHVPSTHQSQNIPQSQPQSLNQAPMPQQSQHQAQNQLEQPISTHGGPLPHQGPPNQPGVSVSGPMGGPMGSNQGPTGQGPPFPSSPGPRGPRGMRPPMGPRGPMGPNAQMGPNTSMGPGGPGGPMGPRGMRPGGPRMRGPRPGMMGPGSRPGLSPSGLLRGPRPMSGPPGDMGDSMSGGPLLNQNGPPGSEFGPPNSMGPLQMGPPPHSMSDVPGDNSSSSMGFPQGMSSQPNQSGMNPNQQGPMNSDTNLVGNSGANNPHINDMSSGGMLPPHSSNSGPFPDQQHQSFNDHLQNGVMKLSLPPLKGPRPQPFSLRPNMTRPGGGPRSPRVRGPRPSGPGNSAASRGPRLDRPKLAQGSESQDCHLLGPDGNPALSITSPTFPKQLTGQSVFESGSNSHNNQINDSNSNHHNRSENKFHNTTNNKSPLDLDSSFPPLSSSNMDLFPLFDAQLPPFSSSSSLLPMLNSSLPPFDTSLPTDPFPPSTATTSLIMSFPGLLSPKSNGHKEPSLLDGLLGLDEQTRKLRQKQQHQVFSKDENLSPIVIKAPNSPRKAMLRSPLRSEPSFEIRSSLEESPEKPVKSSPSQKSFVLSSVRQIESKQDSSNRSGSKESKTQHMAKASSPSPDDSPIQPKDFLSKVTENSSKFISSRDDPMGGSYFMEGPLGGPMDMFNTKSAKDAYNTRSFSLTSSSPPFPSSSPPMMIPESFGREGKDHHHQSPSKVNGIFSKQRSSSGLSPNDEYGSDRRKQFMTTSGNTVELSKPERLSERRDRLNFAMKRGNSSKSSHLNDLSASHDQLSPILDSSPLIEKIESNREKFRDQERQREREREESRKYRDENQHGTSTNRLNHHAGQYGNQLQAGGNNAQLGSAGQPQGESISGMLNNFSKALGNIRDIREKRMKNLGNSPRPSPSDPSSVNYQRIMQQYGGNQYSQGVQQGAPQQRSQYNQMHPQQMNQQQYRQQQPYQQQNYNQQGRMNQQGGGGSGGYGMNQGQQPQQGGYGSYNQQQQQPMGGGMKPNNYGGQMGGMQNHSQPQQQQPMGGVGTQGSQYQQSYMGQQNLHPQQQQQSNQMMGGMPQQGMMNQHTQHLQPHQQQQQQPMGNQMLHPQQSQQQNLVGRHYMSSQPSSMVVQHQPNIPSQFVQPQPTTTYIQSQPPQLQQPQLHQTSYGTSPLPGTGTVVIGPQIAPSSNVLLGAPQSASLFNTSSLGQPQQPTLLSQQSHLLQPQTTQQTLLNALLQQQQQQQQSQQPSTSPNFLAAALAGQHHASLPQTSLFSQINPAGVTHTSLGPLVVHQPQPQLPSAAAALSQAQLVSSSLPAAFTNPLATATNNHLLAASAAASDPLLSQAAASQQQQLLLQNQQLQLQQQQLQLKKMQQRLPHVSGAELKKLQKQIRDLQQQQQLQTLQTLRLAQKQEQQAFKYLNKAIQNRPSRTYQTSHQGKTGASSLLHRRDHLHHHGSHHQPLAHIPSAALLHGATLAMSDLPVSVGQSGEPQNPKVPTSAWLAATDPVLAAQSALLGNNQLTQTRRQKSTADSNKMLTFHPSTILSSSNTSNIEQILLQAAKGQHGGAGLIAQGPFGTPVGTPDTLSEAGSFKSRTRRTLPYLPLEEPAPMPSEKKQRERMRAFANLRQSSLDGLTGRGFRSGTGGFYGSSRPRASSSETNLRKLAMNDHMTRPGSALGLLQASTVVSSKGPTSQTREHEKRILESILPPDLRHLVRGGSPGTIQQMKMKLEDELRKPLETMALATNASEGEMARKKAEARLFGLSGAQSDRIRLEMQRYATMRDPRLRAEMKHKLNPVLDAQLNRNRRTRGHRRNLSDPRFSTSLTDSLGEDDLHYSRPYSSLARDYDPLSDSLGMDNSRSYLGGSALDGMGVAGGGGGLRDTAINSHDLEDNSRNRYLASLSQQLLRRSSEGGSGNTDHLFTRNFDGTSPHTGRRAYSSMSGRAGPRSWHPSPFASDDDASSDEPQFFKEEKKNRIKMEIARRRQQIEENACLHEELTRLAKLRESAEMTGTSSGAPSHLVPSSTAFLGGTIHPANRGMTTAPDGTTSVLKSVDEILRDGGGGGGGGLGTSHHLGLSSDPFHSGMGVTGGANAVGFRGAGMGTFNSDLYTSSVYDRVTDFSPINSELSEFTTPRHMGGGGVGIMGHHHGLRTSAGGGVADDPFWSQGGSICSSLPPRPNSQPSRNQLQRQMSLDPECGFDKAVLSNAKPSKWPHSQSPRRLASLGPGNEVKKVPDNYGTIGGPTRKPKLEGAHNEFSGKKQTSNLHVRSGQDASHTSEYPPLRRILLTKEVNKDFDGPDAFGIRLTHDYVPGTDGQYQGCVVSKVFHGSRADFHGEIYEGDEVKEINGIKMAQKSDFEIKQILNGIRGEADLICRSFTDPFGTHRGIHPLDQITGVVPLDKVTRDDQYLRMNGLRKIPEIHKTHRKKGRYQTRPVLGQVELLLSYDYTQSILYVTVIRGRGLQSFVNGDSRPDAFIMGCLLPQSVYNVRKTRYVLTSSAPLWNDTFVYQDVPISSLRNKSLEISAWSFNRDSCNEYLGELVLDLADLSLINEKPRWFQLFERTSDGVSQFTLPNGRIGGNFHESRSLSSVSFSKGGSLKLKRSIFGQFFNRSKSITDSP